MDGRNRLCNQTMLEIKRLKQVEASKSHKVQVIAYAQQDFKKQLLWFNQAFEAIVICRLQSNPKRKRGRSPSAVKCVSRAQSSVFPERSRGGQLFHLSIHHRYAYHVQNLAHTAAHLKNVITFAHTQKHWARNLKLCYFL